MNFVKKYWFGLYVTFVVVFLVMINNWFWPTPDEYYYATLVRLFSKSLSGEVCLNCFNTEHTFFVPGLVAIINLIRDTGTDLVSIRLPVISFFIAFLFILKMIANVIFIEKKDRFWFVFLTTLIPGLFLFSTRLMLDVPLLFGYSLLSYLLIKRKSYILISLALLVVLLIKEYGFFLFLPIFFVFKFVDDLNFQVKWYKSIFGLLASLIPSLVAIYLLLFTNLFPYPRLLETSLKEYSGGIYYVASDINSIFVENQGLGDFSNIRNVFNILDIGNITRSIESNSSASLRNLLVSNIDTTYKDTLVNRLWLVYSYNFSHQDISVLLFAFFLSGFIMSVRKILNNVKGFKKTRFDIYFFLYSLVFFYLNWHEALNVHGFRLTIPLVLPILYYSTLSFRGLLNGNKKVIFLNLLMLIFSISLYWYHLNSLGSYQSLLSKNSIASWLLENKFLLFTFIYIFLFIILSSKIRKIWLFSKVQLISGMFIVLLLVSFVPAGIDEYLSEKLYGVDYGLPEASSILNKLKENDQMVGANIHVYQMNYYSGGVFTNTVGSYPLNRLVGVGNEWVNRYAESGQANTIDSNINYFFYLNKEVMVNPTSDLFKSLSNNYCVVKKQVYNDRNQWYVFDLNRKLINDCADNIEFF